MIQPIVIVDGVADQQWENALIVKRYARKETFPLITEGCIAHVRSLTGQDEIAARQFRIRMNMSVVGIDVEPLECARQKIQLPHERQFDAVEIGRVAVNRLCDLIEICSNGLTQCVREDVVVQMLVEKAA